MKLLNIACGGRYHKDWTNIDFDADSNLVKKVIEQDFTIVKIPALFYFAVDDKGVRPDKTVQLDRKSVV